MTARTYFLWVTALATSAAFADLYVTNFESAAGALAAGVWKNDTTGADLAIPVKLTQSGAVFDEETVLDGTADWQDLVYNLFEPNYVEDFVSLEVAGGATASVSIAFNSLVVDPVLNFTDVDVQTTLVFNSGSPVKVPASGGAPNLVVSGNSVTTSGTDINPFPGPDNVEVETLGSLKFEGSFTELKFQIVNVGSSPAEDDDRTGFSVSTDVEPIALTQLPQLSVFSMSGDLHVSWPDTNSFSVIEYTMNLETGPWMLFPGADPGTKTSVTVPLSTFDGDVYLRAEYKF